MLRAESQPRQALAKPLLIINIMAQETSREPMMSFMVEAGTLEQQLGILAASILPGFPYADVPQMGPSILIVADGDTTLARREADRLAGGIWDARNQFVSSLPDATQAVSMALK